MRTIRMVFGVDTNNDQTDGGQYGAVGESSGNVVDGSVNPTIMGGPPHGNVAGTMTSNSSSSSRSSVLIEDTDDGGFVSSDVYQRAPLLQQEAGSSKPFKDLTSYINDHLKSAGAVKIPMPSPSREEPRFPKEKMKTAFSFLFLLFNWILTTASLALTHERVPSRPPLPDITLDYVKTQEWGLEASEILILVTVYICLVVIIFHKHRFIIFRRLFLLMGLLYFYRSITMFVTVLPVANPNYYCSPKANYSSAVLVAKRIIQLMSGFGLSINGQHTFCGDYIYSGHTVCLVIAYLIVKEYTPRRWWLLHWMFLFLAALGITFILISRAHYTVDCVIAYYITTRLFYIYHTMANNQNLKDGGNHNHLERLWWFSIFRYFEKNVQGVVPRHYEWPLPWPRRWNSKNPQRTS